MHKFGLTKSKIWSLTYRTPDAAACGSAASGGLKNFASQNYGCPGFDPGIIKITATPKGVAAILVLQRGFEPRDRGARRHDHLLSASLKNAPRLVPGVRPCPTNIISSRPERDSCLFGAPAGIRTPDAAACGSAASGGLKKFCFAKLWVSGILPDKQEISSHPQRG